MQLLKIEQEGTNQPLSDFPEDLHELVKKIRSSYEKKGQTDPWLAYIGIEQNTMVGCIGFKSNPSAQNRVEIAYETFKPNEGKGVATAMCQALISLKTSQTKLFALTLPTNEASERVLEKNGFVKTDTYPDHDGLMVNEWTL